MAFWNDIGNTIGGAGLGGFIGNVWGGPAMGALGNIVGGAAGATGAFQPFGSGDEPAYNPYGGMPQRPQFTSWIDPKTGQLDRRYSLGESTEGAMKGVKADTRGADAIRERATATGPSAWALMMEQKQGLGEAQRRDQATREMAAANATARGQLAARGGLSSGARERLARGGARDMVMAGQETARQGMLDRMNIGIQDQGQKDRFLGMMPGIEQQQFQNEMEKAKIGQSARQWDIANTLKEKYAQDAHNMDAYTEQMKAWAANRQATATENAGKK